jgi:CHAT domain-containing protein
VAGTPPDELTAAWPDLEHTEAEVLEIGAILAEQGWESEVHTWDGATKARVLSLGGVGLLHVAAHGFFSPPAAVPRTDAQLAKLGIKWRSLVTEDPMGKSGLVLAGARDYQAKLTAIEASHIDLRGTELVVLSACDTAAGAVGTGEGVFGLQRAFRIAGARTVLMSLWKVDDTVTRELMVTFYRKWFEIPDKHAAFRAAQREIRARYPVPLFWGGFVMIGV